MPNKSVRFYTRQMCKDGKAEGPKVLRTFIGYIGQDYFMDEAGRIPRWRAQELVDEWNIKFSFYAKYEVKD